MFLFFKQKLPLSSPGYSVWILTNRGHEIKFIVTILTLWTTFFSLRARKDNFNDVCVESSKFIVVNHMQGSQNSNNVKTKGWIFKYASGNRSFFDAVSPDFFEKQQWRQRRQQQPQSCVNASESEVQKKSKRSPRTTEFGVEFFDVRSAKKDSFEIRISNCGTRMVQHHDRDERKTEGSRQGSKSVKLKINWGTFVRSKVTQEWRIHSSIVDRFQIDEVFLASQNIIRQSLSVPSTTNAEMPNEKSSSWNYGGFCHHGQRNTSEHKNQWQEGAGHKLHQDHKIAEASQSWWQTHSNVLNIRNKVQRQQWRRSGKTGKSRHGSWRKSETTKEVIDEARNKGRKVHFATLMDFCHLQKSKLEPQYQKSTKAGSCSEMTVWKII